MIGVKGAEHIPRVLLTVDYGCEASVAYEVENALFELDQNVRCSRAPYRGILLVYLSRDLDPLDVVKLLRRKKVSRVRWAIPIYMVTRSSYEDICRACIELVLLTPFSKPMKVLGVCRKRGLFIDSCSNLLRYVGQRLESLGLVEVDFHGYQYVLRIEILDHEAFLSIYRRDVEALLRGRTSS